MQLDYLQVNYILKIEIISVCYHCYQRDMSLSRIFIEPVISFAYVTKMPMHKLIKYHSSEHHSTDLHN